jgi:hypothetical protein
VKKYSEYLQFRKQADDLDAKATVLEAELAPFLSEESSESTGHHTPEEDDAYQVKRSRSHQRRRVKKLRDKLAMVALKKDKQAVEARWEEQA